VPTASLLLLPLVIGVHFAFTAAIALLLSMANLFYRDVKYLFELMVTVWMFATAVLYPVDRVGGWAAVVMTINPMTPIIEAYRAVLLGVPMTSPASFAGAAGLSVVLLLGSWLLFHRSEYEFAESL
jgi:ABC-type polysaccharide/polyol phosphate export permease